MSPRAILITLQLLLLLALAGGAVWQEHRVSAAQEAQGKAERAKKAAEGQRDDALAGKRAAEANVKTVTHYVDRVQVVRVKGDTITREIPAYVTEKSDAACTVPVGFVRLHNAAAANEPPEPAAGDPDAPAAGIALSDVAGVLAENYTAYHVLAQQVIGLQEYLRSRPECPAR